MKITCLIENTSVRDDITAEHGLSLYVETDSVKLLFDMGQTELFAYNAEKLGVDLSAVDVAVLSHGHYDHGGGLARFLELNDKAPVYVSRYAFREHLNATGKYIGLDAGLCGSERIVFTDDYTQIGNGMSLYSCNACEMEYPTDSIGLGMIKDDEVVQDDFCHEQYLLIEEKGRRILFSGCSHKGILNIVKWFSPDVLIGGFHLSKVPVGEKLTEYANRLSAAGTVFYTCHCTGVAQYDFMANAMPKLTYISAGQSITI